MSPLWCHQPCSKSKPSAQRVAMLNVRRSTIKAQCPMLNVSLLNEQCTMCNKQRPACNVQGARAMYQRSTPTNFQINNQLSTGSTVGSPWSGLRYQFEGSNNCNQSKNNLAKCRSLENGQREAFHANVVMALRCSSCPSHLRRSRVTVAKGFVPKQRTFLSQPQSMSWSDIHIINIYIYSFLCVQLSSTIGGSISILYTVLAIA